MKNRILPTNKNTVAKLILMGGLLAFFNTSCEKEPTPTKPDPNQPKIARLVFDKNGHHIEFDTIDYYLSQGVDSIYMIANPSDMFAAQSSVHNATGFLRQRWERNPQKVRGFGDLKVNKKTDPNDRNLLTQMGFNVVIASK